MYALNNKEKAYLRGIAINTRNDFLKNEKYKKYEEIELEETEEIVDKDNKIEDILVVIDNENVDSYCIEKVFEDKKIMKIVEALTLKEKLVLFSFYFENNTDLEISKALNEKADTIKKVRQRALIKIKNKYLENGGDKNV